MEAALVVDSTGLVHLEPAGVRVTSLLLSLDSSPSQTQKDRTIPSRQPSWRFQESRQDPGSPHLQPDCFRSLPSRFLYGNGEFLCSLCTADRSLAGISLLRVGSLPAAPEQSRQRFAGVPTPGAFLSSLRESEPLLWRHFALMGPGLWHLSTRQRALSARSSLRDFVWFRGSVVCCQLSAFPAVPAPPPARQQ